MKKSSLSIRPIAFKKAYLPHAEGSCLVTMGKTKVVCVATIEQKVPPFAEAKGGFYKSGGTQGACVFNDFLPEFQSGKVAIAVKGFLRRTSHRNKPAPPRGRLSVWMEAAEIPAVVLQTIGTARK